MSQQQGGSNAGQAKVAEEKVPGRIVGVTVMTLTIVFVALWMNIQSELTDDQTAATISADNRLAGFRSEAWFLPDDAMLGFVEIPAGTFIMGSNPAVDRMAYENERWSNLRRQGSVDLPTFYISRFEVTVAQYNTFVAASGAESQISAAAGPGNFPVSNVTWPEALAYARWLEQQLKASEQTPLRLRQLLNNGGHVTLPTEAEWEKAARGTDGRVFPWGSQAREDRANFNANSVSRVGAVACLQCAHGLSDMAGNVWELTRSPLQDYPYDPDDDAENLSADALWVMRGGSYADGIANIRSAVRGGIDPGVRNDAIGFRLVISTL